jgi:hypothetical protein
MNDSTRTKSDILEPKNIAKIVICAIFVSSVLFIMTRGFLYSNIVTAANQIRYKVLENDIILEYIRVRNIDGSSYIEGKAKNRSYKTYWAVVFDIDLFDTIGKKIGRIRAGGENIRAGEEFYFSEKANYPNINSIKLFRIDGIEQGKKD